MEGGSRTSDQLRVGGPNSGMWNMHMIMLAFFESRNLARQVEREKKASLHNRKAAGPGRVCASSSQENELSQAFVRLAINEQGPPAVIANETTTTTTAAAAATMREIQEKKMGEFLDNRLECSKSCIPNFLDEFDRLVQELAQLGVMLSPAFLYGWLVDNLPPGYDDWRCVLPSDKLNVTDADVKNLKELIMNDEETIMEKMWQSGRWDSDSE